MARCFSAKIIVGHMLMPVRLLWHSIIMCHIHKSRILSALVARLTICFHFSRNWCQPLLLMLEIYILHIKILTFPITTKLSLLTTVNIKWKALSILMPSAPVRLSLLAKWEAEPIIKHLCSIRRKLNSFYIGAIAWALRYQTLWLYRYISILFISE